MRSLRIGWWVILALLLWCLCAAGQAPARSILVEALKPGVSLTIDKGCGAIYEHGETLDIKVRSNRTGYLTVFDFSPDGQVQIIFPNQYYRNNEIQADVEYPIPGDRLPFQFRIAPPDGEEVILAVVTDQPYALVPDQASDFMDIFQQLSGTAEETANILTRQLEVVPTYTWSAVAMSYFTVGQPSPTVAGDGWALFLGVDDYDETAFEGEDGKLYSFPELRYCVKGAQEFAEALQPQFPNQRLLMDREVTHSNVRDTITEWLGQAPEGSRVLIYYSGHGSRTPDENGDEADGYDETLVPWDYGKRNKFITDDELRDWVSGIQAEQVIMVFDSCHSGTMERNVYTARLLSADGSRAVEPVLTDGMDADFDQLDGARGTGRKHLVIAACRPDEVAYESSRLENGALTYYLLEALGGAGDADADDWVTAQEAYEYAARKVTLSFPTQHPQLTDTIDDPVRLKELE